MRLIGVFSKTRSAERRPPIYLHRLKYILLSITIALAIFGVLLPLFFDPILLITRIFTFIADPLLRILINDSQHAVSIFSQRTADYLYQTLSVTIPLYIGMSLTTLLTLFIFAGTSGIADSGASTSAQREHSWDLQAD